MIVFVRVIGFSNGLRGKEDSCCSKKVKCLEDIKHLDRTMAKIKA
jgi:hypothetical protein